MLRKIGFALLAVSFLTASPSKIIYAQNCASCHGLNGDRKTMGSSEAIKEMSVEEIEKAVIDYVSGERKSQAFVRNLKKAFMKKHTKEELHELATYIHHLK